MKKKKLLTAAGAGIGLLAAAALIMPPLLLSSNWVRRFALERLNRSIPGELAAGSCSIGWKQGAACSDVIYTDAAQGIHLDIAALRSSQGLWALLMAPEDLGEISINTPTLLLTLKPEPPPAAPGADSAATAAAAPDKKAQADKAAASAPASTAKTQDSGLPQGLKGRLLISGMTVKTVQAGQEPQTLLRNGALKADIAAGQQINFDLKADSGEKGQAVLSGSSKLAELIHGSLSAAEMRLKLDNVQAQPFLALKSGKDGLPQGSGKLSAELKLKGAADGGLTLSGPAALTEVDLTGGFLGEDRPRFNQLALDLDLRQLNGGWQFPSLKLASDFGSLSLQCAYSGSNFQGGGSGRIDLALLLAQFPRLFKVQEDLRLDRGELTLSADLLKEGGKLHVSAETAVDSLAGRQNSQAFSWEHPLRLKLAGSMENKEPEIEKLSLNASFLDLEGKGNLRHFSFSGTADIDQTMQEVNRLFRTGWDAGGKLRLQAELTKQDNGRYLAETKAEIEGSRLVRQGKEILPPGKTSFSGRLNTPGQVPENSKDAAELTFDLATWAGQVSGTVDGLHRKGGQLSAGYQLHADMLLGRVVELLHKFEALAQDTSLGGSLTLHASGYTEDSRVVLRELDSRVKDFILYQKGKVIREPELRLAVVAPETAPAADKALRPLIEADSKAAFFANGGGHSLIDPAARRLILRGVHFVSSFAAIDIQQLAVDDWRPAPLPAVKIIQLSGSSELAKLTPLLQQLSLLTPDKKLGGAASFTAELSSQDGLNGGGAGRSSNGTLDVTLNRFMYGGEGGIIAAKDKTEFRTRLHGDLAAGDIYFTTFDLLSPPLSVQSNGKLELSGKNPHFALEGEATPDLADLVAILNGMYPLGISAEGRNKEKFSLHYPLDKKRQQIDLSFAGRVHADTFAKSGISISGLSAETAMKQGIMSAALKGDLNGGKVQFTPKIDYTRKPPVLALAGPEQVLDRVGLAETLADGLLKTFHPLLGTLARPAGSISMRAERLSLPLGGKGMEQADFSLRFDLASVVLEPVSALSGILDMAGLGGQPLQLREKSLVCEGRKGRISCSPIKITAADSEMILSGSAGFDGSLDYVLEVPVTRNLVGKKGYELLKGSTLKVPIKGSKDKAVYSPEALLQAASDLVRQAAGQAAEEAVKEQVRKVLPKEVEKALPGLFDGLLGR
ncbi:hypothetical protein [Candidatus Electronema sp. TJ]|uniref:hypothetical protein n=1 Tax=Candidatus Electronema sp. TJ TaxID=3401573 RepID=UPI003AA7BE74